MKNYIILLILIFSFFQISIGNAQPNRLESDYSFNHQLDIEHSYYLYNHTVKGYANISISVAMDILNITNDHLFFGNGSVLSNVTSYGIDVSLNLNILHSTFDTNFTLANATVGIGEYFNLYSVYVDKDFIINKTFIAGDSISIHRQVIFTILDAFIPKLNNFSVELTTSATNYYDGFHYLSNGSLVNGPYSYGVTDSDAFYYPLDQTILNSYARTTTSYGKPVSTITKTVTSSVPFMTEPIAIISMLFIIILKSSKAH